MAARARRYLTPKSHRNIQFFDRYARTLASQMIMTRVERLGGRPQFDVLSNPSQ
jgi:hypothetical protein